LNAFTNKIQEEQQFLAQWRREGPLGILIAIINYIKTPQQYDLFASFQKIAADEVPLELRHKALEPVSLLLRAGTRFIAPLSMPPFSKARSTRTLTTT
jgi:hypothetical protein